MFQSLATYLTDKGDFTAEELKQIEEAVTLKKLRKRQYLLQEGDVSRCNTFVVKGCLRLYRVSSDGTEHILRFAVENWWISDYESYNSGLPSKLNIDALEDCELIMIEKEKLEALFVTVPNLQKLVQKLDSRNFEVTQNRILSYISETAEEKYENFIKSYPQFYNRVPLHMVASFLGLSRETLSRIRQKYAKKAPHNV